VDLVVPQSMSMTSLCCSLFVLLLASDLSLATRFTQQEKADVLAAHNTARCAVSPTATSMPPLVWDDALEVVAQNFVDGCPSGHNAARSTQYGTGYVGENFAAGYSTGASAVTDGWVSEVAYFTFSSNACVSGQECGHYTQVVWAGSTLVGCAKPTQTNCPTWGDKIYICDYAPGGNYVGEQPYTSGTGTNAACAGGGSIPSAPVIDNGGGSVNGGAIAAGVLVPLIVIGLAVVIYIYRVPIRNKWNKTFTKTSGDTKPTVTPSSPSSYRPSPPAPSPPKFSAPPSAPPTRPAPPPLRPVQSQIRVAPTRV